MASLAWYIRKFGKTAGRKEYNAYHRAYRKTRRKKMSTYFKEYRGRKNAAACA